MKTIIAGSRTIKNYAHVAWAIEQSGISHLISEVVCGEAPGVDQRGDEWAEDHGLPVTYFPARWTRDGKSAGAVRNRHMADYADALIAVWDGQSRGTQHVIQAMEKLAKPVYTWHARTENGHWNEHVHKIKEMTHGTLHLEGQDVTLAGGESGG